MSWHDCNDCLSTITVIMVIQTEYCFICCLPMYVEICLLGQLLQLLRRQVTSYAQVISRTVQSRFMLVMILQRFSHLLQLL